MRISPSVPTPSKLVSVMRFSRQSPTAHRANVELSPSRPSRSSCREAPRQTRRLHAYERRSSAALMHSQPSGPTAVKTERALARRAVARQVVVEPPQVRPLTCLRLAEPLNRANLRRRTLLQIRAEGDRVGSEIPNSNSRSRATDTQRDSEGEISLSLTISAASDEFSDFGFGFELWDFDVTPIGVHSSPQQKGRVHESEILRHDRND